MNLFCTKHDIHDITKLLLSVFFFHFKTTLPCSYNVPHKIQHTIKIQDIHSQLDSRIQKRCPFVWASLTHALHCQQGNKNCLTKIRPCYSLPAQLVKIYIHVRIYFKWQLFTYFARVADDSTLHNAKHVAFTTCINLLQLLPPQAQQNQHHYHHHNYIVDCSKYLMG